MSRTLLITGGSSGIGRATAELFAAKGWRVYELSRRTVDIPGVTHITADVTDSGSVESAVAQVAEEAGRIDLLICNAGSGISGAVEFTRGEDAKKLFDINFFGTAAACTAVLPRMRAAGGGRIICLSSLAAVIPIPFQTYYSASKAAINAFVMCLANEAKPFGVSVCAVMPGDIKTSFTDARRKLHEGDDIYGGRISRSVGAMERDERGGMPPSAIAKKLYALSERKSVKPFYTVGFGYGCAAAAIKLLPARLANTIIGKLYAK